MLMPSATTVRTLKGPAANELYLTATPPAGLSAAAQARALYAAVRQALDAAGACLFTERVFAAADAFDAVTAERRAALGDLDDGVPPSCILVEPGLAGQVAGVQVHAVAADTQPEPLGHAPGRELCLGPDRWMTLAAVGPDVDGPPAEQARRVFQRTGQALRQAGTSMRSVARTWLWLADICRWYNDFNAARTAFFKSEGLVGANGDRPRLPASTGIGLGAACGAACTLDLLALPGREDHIELLTAAGEQDSAFNYGSAFSRAAVVPMPAGRTLLISGTAAIDSQGRTEHVGQVEAQIEATIQHVRALMASVGCADNHVLSALVYCKLPEVERAFRTGWADLPWPSVSMLAEVCRSDLLFEVELVAGPVPEKRVEE